MYGCFSPDFSKRFHQHFLSFSIEQIMFREPTFVFVLLPYRPRMMMISPLTVHRIKWGVSSSRLNSSSKYKDPLPAGCSSKYKDPLPVIIFQIPFDLFHLSLLTDATGTLYFIHGLSAFKHSMACIQNIQRIRYYMQIKFLMTKMALLPKTCVNIPSIIFDPLVVF
jgi:hypothetical protein